MKNTYFNLINQTYQFPQEGFNLKDGLLTFHDIPIRHLIDKYGTPFRLFFLPEISAKIKKARKLFQKARELFVTDGDQNNVKILDNILATIPQIDKKYKDLTAKEAIQVFDDEKNTLTSASRGEIAIMLAEKARKMSMLQESRTLYSDALENYNNTDDDINTARVLNGLAMISRQERDYNNAIKIVKKSLNIYKKNNRQREIARAYSTLGELHLIVNKLNISAQYFQNSINIYKNNDYRDDNQLSYNNLGLASVLHKKGAKKDAYQLISNVKAQFENLTNISGLAESNLTHGLLLNSDKNASEAIKNFVIARNLFEKEDNLNGLARTNLWLGLVTLQIGQIEDAENFFILSKKNYEDINNLDGVTQVLIAISDLKFADNKPNQARTHLQQAIEIVKSMGLDNRVKLLEKRIEDMSKKNKKLIKSG